MKGRAVAFRVPGHASAAGGRPVVLPRWPRFVVPAIIAVVAAAVLISIAAGIWTDFLWYRSVSQTRVFSTTYSTRWLLFLVGALFMIGAVGANMVLAYRLRPEEPAAVPGQQGVEAYRQAIDPHRRGVSIVVLGLIGLVAGLTAAGNWQIWLLFVNRVKFGATDPQFHLDLSFFVFVYPFLRLALSFLFAAVLLSLVLAAAVHVLYGGLRPARHAQPTTGARTHLFVLVGIFVALKAGAYWVDRYGISFSQRGVVQTGASYTDVNAVLPAKTVLAAIAVICAILFFAGAVRRSSLLPAIGFGLLVLSAVLIGGVYPFVIQQFVVKPNEQVKERPYIAREITNTRAAYGVAGAQVIPYNATPNQSKAQLARAALAMPDLRLLDPGVLSAAFQQLQQVKGYYQFSGVLSMDRYIVGANGVPQDMLVSVRDMAGPPAGQVNWINTHLIYTHGFGFVAALASTADSNGNPQFAEADIPPTGELGSFHPRIYFGNEGASYVIVGGHQQELDYPNESTGGQHNNSYNGGGGVPVGSFGSRLLYAVKFRDLNIMLSSALDSHSRILYIRNPLARVAKVAPFLTLDGDYYPVISGGQVLWVVDGYTTTDNYPYSKRLSLSQATSNTYSPGGSAIGPTGEINYIRNSVKVTVNAYTGAVTIYQWRAADPILRTWMKVFPGLIHPESTIPATLRPHLRYPEVLFDAQRQILAQFHVLQPSAFYGGQNFWTVPNDPTLGPSFKLSQPPYYMTIAVPGSSAPEFSLTSLFTPRARPNLAAYMAVNSDPKSPDYGQIRILQLPQDTAIFGPQQVQSNFESNTIASSQLSLYRQGGSKVILGNLVTVPLGGDLLSIEPVYLQASNAGNTGAYPQLQRILTYYNNQTGFAPTLAASLAQVFSTAVQGSGGPTGGSTGGHVSAAVVADLKLAEKYYGQAQAALRSGNLALYGQDIAKVKAALDLAQQAAQASPPGTGKHPPVSPAPSQSPSQSPSPSPSS
jgi:uncharacterized protein